MLVQMLPSATDVVSGFSLAGLWTAIREAGPFFIAIAISTIVVVIVLIGLLIAAVVFGLLGLYHGATNHTQQALRHASRGAWFVLAVMLTSAIGLIVLNIIFNWQIQGGAESFGIEYVSIKYVWPSVFIWLLLVASAALIIDSAIVRNHLKRRV